ncbi:RNA-directed DNA polymerase [Chryseobacterium soli]|uniref:antiviral reverse transcriptase Drt3a n=1 Tax=Chryseobacterium soli TaxID=445961 RepID=UPI002955B512|nr:antiviral reverse transcriptase Drt3a [Chryseobacterium soli]MDV7695459.1 RNA-directed DNA polymerase [Chryseobacterium soli]
MKQNFNSKELIKYLKKGELIRNELDIEDVESEIATLEEQVLNESFEFDIKFNDEYYFLENISQKLLLRKLNDNIKRIYKDEQANRKFIIHQVKTLLKETAPFWIIKTDIRAFYESINRDRIFRKLKNDAMLSYYSIFLLKKVFENPNIISYPGLPRGLNISSSLSEIYMRNFDKAIQRHKDVYYYARFVDDIIIFLNSKERALELFQSLNSIISEEKLDLQINDDKTELIDGTNFKILKKGYNKRPIHNNIEYLGYRFYLNETESKRENKLQVSIAYKKIKKIKSRIVRSYVDYAKTNDFELLKKRIKFLTGNYGISKSNDGSILKAGIYFNYTHINNLEILKELNIFHKKIIYSRKGNLGIKLNARLSNTQRDILKKHCFIAGFRNKTFNSFTFVEMGQIIKSW